MFPPYIITFYVENIGIKLNAEMARRMISKMLKIDPIERYTINEALQDPYVNFWKRAEKENARLIQKFSIDTQMVRNLAEWKELIYNKLENYVQTHDVTVDPNLLLNYSELNPMTNFNKLWNFFTKEIDDTYKDEFIKMHKKNLPNNVCHNSSFMEKVYQFEEDRINFQIKYLENTNKLLGFEFPLFNEEFEFLEFKLHDIYEIYFMEISNVYHENRWLGKRFNHDKETSMNNLNTLVKYEIVSINVTPSSLNIKFNGQLVVDSNELSIEKILIKECDKYFYFEMYPLDYTNHLTRFCLVFVNLNSQNICREINWKLTDIDITSSLPLLKPLASHLPNFPLFSDLSPVKKNVLFKGFFNTTFLYTLQNPQHIPTNQVAVKKLNKHPAYLREVNNLLMCDHENVIKCFGCYQDSKHYYFVMEYLKGGTLKEYLMDHQKPLTVGQAFEWIKQTLDGMCYLAERKIMHRYLAACNCFLTEDYKTIKIGEFVLSRLPTLSYRYTSIMAPRMPFRWMALDFLQEQPYHERMDVWSVAVLIWEIFSREQQPYKELQTCDEIIEYLKEGKRLLCPVENYPHELNGLLSKCWSQLYFLRPTFEELRQEFNVVMENFHNNIYRGFGGETLIVYENQPTIQQ